MAGGENTSKYERRTTRLSLDADGAKLTPLAAHRCEESDGGTLCQANRGGEGSSAGVHSNARESESQGQRERVRASEEPRAFASSLSRAQQTRRHGSTRARQRLSGEDATVHSGPAHRRAAS
jgi:hypothetical protein